MSHYLSHWSAINEYGSSYIQNTFAAEIKGDNKTHYTVFCRKDLFSKKGCVVHLRSVQMPKGTQIYLNGKKVVVPELAFLQLAKTLDIHRLILLGLLLCGKPKEDDLPPITSKVKLLRRIDSIEKFECKTKAKLALKYVEDSCRSPMEAMLYMMLSLPYSLGGYGLSGASFDFKIQLNAENSRTLNQRAAFADIYFKSAKLFVEYDSKEFHSKQSDFSKDSRRTAAIIRQNYQIITVRTNQIYDVNRFTIVAKNVAKSIGKRIRIKNTSQFNSMHEKIRALLPRLDQLPSPKRKW